MKRSMVAVTILSFALAGMCVAQQSQAADPAFSDLYHVHFVQATPGKTADLQKTLTAASVETPMPLHVLILRHLEGDSWDFASVAHEGPSYTVKASDLRMTPARELREKHTDTIAAGPAWPEFAKAMGLSGPQAGAAAADSAVYIVTTYRGLPDRREQLYQTLLKLDRAARNPGRQVILRHAEGGDWDYVTIARYDSWQDLATDQGPNPQAEQRLKQAGVTMAPGLELRQSMIEHHDTITTRIPVQAAK